MCLADADELGGIECVFVDGRAVAWKRAGRFADGARFERAQRLWCSESPKRARTTGRAGSTTTWTSRPDLRGDPEAICALFGYPAEALAEARRAEAAQPAEKAEWGTMIVKAALAACAAFLAWLFRAVFRWFM